MNKRGQFLIGLVTFMVCQFLTGCVPVKSDNDVQLVSSDYSASAGQSVSSQDTESMYKDGLVLKELGQLEEAFTRFLAAAGNGHDAAAYATGVAYSRGEGVTVDLEKGAEWINVAAERGEPRAEYLIGASLFSGSGVQLDHGRAVGYLRKAALQGHARAQYLMGEAYAGGLGVKKDPGWAARWYGKSAWQGHGKAQFNYGVMSFVGDGLVKDDVVAYVWLTLAEQSGYGDAAPMRSLAKGRLNDSQLSQAGKWIDRFTPTESKQFADAPTVVYLQTRLQKLGFDPGPIDGVVGPRTKAAIDSFQLSNGVSVNGGVTPSLLDQLRLQSNL